MHALDNEPSLSGFVMVILVPTHVNFFISKLVILGLVQRLKSQENKEEEDLPAITLPDIMQGNYDCLRSPKRQGNPTSVRLRIWLLNIRSMDDKDMTFTADLFMQQFWEDRRLTFPNFITGFRLVIHPDWREKIWYPDIYIMNAVESKIDAFLRTNIYMWLYHNSTVCLAGKFSIKTSCDMNLHSFPHDTQTCVLKLVSLSYLLEDMTLHWLKGGLGGFILSKNVVLPEFEMLNLSTVESTMELSAGTSSYLEARMHFKRREGYFVINVYIPTILIVSMSMLTFWIPPDAVPARVTLGVTSLLTMITKQYQSNMPNVSYIVALNVWLSCCIAFVFCSLLEYAIVIALLAKYRNQVVDTVNSSARSRQRVLKKVRSPYNNAWPKPPEYEANRSTMAKLPYLIDYASRVLFPCSFVAMAIVYWKVYTEA